MPANCPSEAGVSNTAFGWLMNSTFRSSWRDESSAERGERKECRRQEHGFEQIQPVVQRSTGPIPRAARIFRGCLASAAITRKNGAGPRRPNAARALCEESYIDGYCRGGGHLACRKPRHKTKPTFFLIGPVREAAWLVSPIPG